MSRLATAAIAITLAAAAAAAQVVDYEIIEIVPPQRMPGPPPRQMPPELPAAYIEAPPLTLEVTTQWRPGASVQEQTQIVVRTSDRVLIEYPDLGQQWLFEQNPVDPRRVHGKLIIPPQLMVIEYTETDLSDSGVAGSWLDVMSLGMPPAAIEHMVPTEDTMRVDHVTARRYTLSDEQRSQGAALTELWWSDELLIPLRVVQNTAVGERIMEVRSIDPEVNESKLLDPSEGKRLIQRMFTKLDVSDWREEYHGNHIHIAGLPCGVMPSAASNPSIPAQGPAPGPTEKPAR